MRQLVALFLSFLLATPVAAACTGNNIIATLSDADRSAIAAAVAAHPYPEGNLWVARKGARTVHVVGTVHIPDPRLDPMVVTVAPILRGAEILILEATAEDQAALQRVMTERPDVAFLTEGPTLIDLLGDTLWAKVTDELNKRGIPPFMAAKFRPWLLSMTLAIPQCAAAAMASGEAGLDGQLEDIAREAGVPVASLDDPEALLDMLTQGSLEEQIAMLRLSLSIETDTEDAMATTLDSYFAGRHRELWEFSRFLARDMDIDDAVFEWLERDLLNNRNAAWEPKIASLLSDQGSVIAVGAAHLSGETGVLRALERMGFTLEPL